MCLAPLPHCGRGADPRITVREAVRLGRAEAGQCYAPLGTRGKCTSGAPESIRCDASLRLPRRVTILDDRFSTRRPIMAMPIQTRESGFKTNPDYRSHSNPRHGGARQIQRRDHCRQHQRPSSSRRASAVYYFPRSTALRSDDPYGSSHLLPYKGTGRIGPLRSATRCGERGVGLSDPSRGGGAQGCRRVLLGSRGCVVRGGRGDFVHPRDPYSGSTCWIVTLGANRRRSKVIAETRRARFSSRPGYPPAITFRLRMCGWSFSCEREGPACPTRQGPLLFGQGRDRRSADLVGLPRPDPGMPKIRGYLLLQRARGRHPGGRVSVPRPLTPWSKDWKRGGDGSGRRGPVVRP